MSSKPSGRSPFDYAILTENIFSGSLLPLIVINWKILLHMERFFSALFCKYRGDFEDDNKLPRKLHAAYQPQKL
jgi:hypothetical protein